MLIGTIADSGSQISGIKFFLKKREPAPAAITHTHTHSVKVALTAVQMSLAVGAPGFMTRAAE